MSLCLAPKKAAAVLVALFPPLPIEVPMCFRADAVIDVWSPVESLLESIERTGCAVMAGRKVVMPCEEEGWYSAIPALRGLLDYHRLVGERIGIPADYAPLEKLANKLDAGSPLFEGDIASARAAVESCKRQAMSMTTDVARDVSRTISIRIAMKKAGIV